MYLKDVSTVSWLLEIGTQMGPMISCVQSERGEEVLVIAESTLELREAILKDFSWFRLVVVNVGLEGRQGHRAIRGIRLQKFPQDPRLVGVTCGNRAKLPERFCPALLSRSMHLLVDKVPFYFPRNRPPGHGTGVGMCAHHLRSGSSQQEANGFLR